MLHVTKSSGLTADLIAIGVRDVTDATAVRAAYSTDASLYRVVPDAVAFPASTEELHACAALAAERGVPLTMRGAGTSIAGNAVGSGLVVDTSRHLNRVLSVDPEAGTAVVQPGVVQADLQSAAAPYGLRFGPDPSTSSRCTIGGMIGNNACGSRSLGYGRTSDNVLALRGVFGTGTPFDTAARAADGGPATAEERALVELAAGELALIRTRFGRFARQVSGYAMERLLPEHGRDVASFLVGSEGTLAVLSEATVRLVRPPAHRVLVALGFPDIVGAADATPAVLGFDPVACEGMDRRLVNILRAQRGDVVPPLPRGEAWLFVELADDDAGALRKRADRLAAEIDCLEATVVTDAAAMAALWGVRADGAGLAGRSPAGLPAYAGWEDAAVPPEGLGAYLREFDELTDSYGLTTSPYGHFGEGCVHVRLDLPLQRADGPQVLADFMAAAADLVVAHGGSLSGEHGDGRARSELLPRMFSPEVIRMFGEVKRICDPDVRLNPGVLVEPNALNADLRFPTPPSRSLGLAFAADGGDFAQAVHRCTGVGKCRADTSASGGVMCPSFQATRDELHSTRGRARLLQEMVNGTLVEEGWRSPEVHEALDLCLSCKGCASDCPTGTDMASMKAEVLYRSYRGRVRPRTHYTLGRLPSLLRLGRRIPGALAAGLRLADAVGPLKRLAGVDPRRSLPRPAPRAWAPDDVPTLDAVDLGSLDHPVLLLPDTFTTQFAPEVGDAAVAVLRDAGYTPVLPTDPVCCGLTLISTGQLDAARSTLASTARALAPAVEAGVPVVGLEPSCTAVLRHELPELVTGDRAAGLSAATTTLAGLLARTPGWTPPRLDGVEVVAQPHCHQHAILGWQPDADLLAATGAEVRPVGGCCGLAGNFGMEQGHYEVSTAVFGHDLGPALADRPDAVFLADGFSCRTQAADLAGRRGVHLAQLLASPRNHPLQPSRR
ncbi:FAD-binding and (Fe-S)-binding domain-containing protein [Nocardioides rotundus]|uniref:FAD-binding and (Fe-S)-binding domain-containing protein n=1 Tax=Nocardioides rotundus TaxID=1774216 RepID=UPI001CBB8F82|nr:FAD-binding and (Fe-S)-binding domain-containing protein [Nocardioides rotundus]